MFTRIVGTFLNVFIACEAFEAKGTYAFVFVTIWEHGTRSSIFAWHRSTQIGLFAMLA